MYTLTLKWNGLNNGFNTPHVRSQPCSHYTTFWHEIVSLTVVVFTLHEWSATGGHTWQDHRCETLHGNDAIQTVQVIWILICRLKKQYERENDTGERMDYDALSARLFFRWERMTACSYYCLARTRGYTYWNSCVYILWQTMGYCCAHFIGNRYQMRLGWGSFPQCFLMWLQLNLTEFQ